MLHLNTRARSGPDALSRSTAAAARSASARILGGIYSVHRDALEQTPQGAIACVWNAVASSKIALYDDSELCYRVD
jgi:hypothetical protein